MTSPHDSSSWDTVADLYVIIFDAALADSTSPAHGREGFYFGENGEHRLYDVGKRIAQVLYDFKKGRSADPTTFTREELRKYFPQGTSLGTNSRCRADRSRSIGWKPVKTTEDMLASIRPEVEAWIHRSPSEV